MTKRIVLCADDYGQAPAINAGILSLIEQKRVSAVSCLTNFPGWIEAAKCLLNKPVDIGLHFNLTEGSPLSVCYSAAYGQQFSPLGKTLIRAFLRQWDKKALYEELNTQIDVFEAAMGFMPRFIDGHQHIHQFPQIRNVLLEVYKERLDHSGAYIRLAMPPVTGFKNFKQLIIGLSGWGFRQCLLRMNIPHNTSFSGSYAFNDAAQYRRHFQQFLLEIEEGGLIMCHPALQSGEGLVDDAIAKARYNEYSYLYSDAFTEDCQLRGVKIAQFSAKALI